MDFLLARGKLLHLLTQLRITDFTHQIIGAIALAGQSIGSAIDPELKRLDQSEFGEFVDKRLVLRIAATLLATPLLLLLLLFSFLLNLLERLEHFL